MIFQVSTNKLCRCEYQHQLILDELNEFQDPRSRSITWKESNQSRQIWWAL